MNLTATIRRLNDGRDLRASRDENPNFAGTLAKGLMILQAFVREARPLANSEIAARLELPRPTVSRLCRTLLEMGYLDHDDRIDRYFIGPAVVALGYPYVVNTPLLAHARPAMQALADEVHGAVSVGVAVDLEVVYVETCAWGTGTLARPAAGAFRAVAATAMGRAWLETLDAATRSALLVRLRCERPDEMRHCAAGIDESLARLTERGFAVNFCPCQGSQGNQESQDGAFRRRRGDRVGAGSAPAQPTARAQGHDRGVQSGQPRRHARRAPDSDRPPDGPQTAPRRPQTGSTPMTRTPYSSALIVGAGPGLGASLARAFTRDAGMRVIVAARSAEKLQAIADETGAAVMTCDATDAAAVAALFDAAERHLDSAPDVVVYNASQRVRGAFIEVDAAAVAKAVAVTAHGAFLVAQHAARRMVPKGQGAILFTGASAGVKGFAQSAAFAMGKFALRGLAQSMARELSPQGIHVGHVVVDGSIRQPGQAGEAQSDDRLDPDAIAATYLHLLTQPRNAWSWEIEVRPWVERF